MHEPEQATEKAKDLVRMAVAKAQLIQPLQKNTVEIDPTALVVGGGITGMQASLDLASFGFETHLVEKSERLGGILNKIHHNIDGSDIQAFLKRTIEQVKNHEKIKIHMNSELIDVSGYIGNFKTVIKKSGSEHSIHHGIAIIATGGEIYEPNEYLYGKDPGVINQLEFEKRLEGGASDLGTVAMIQCVGCRNEERPYCSRVCCTEAIKNAMKLKEQNPESRIYIMFKDMRTYGFRELYYEEAARSGVTFIRYYDDTPPVVTKENGLQVTVYDHFITEDIEIKPDLLVLSAATLPNKDNEKLNKLFKVPLSKDKFFLEAHMKLRPLDFATDGVFLAGLAHSPKFLEECLGQASGAAARAATVLSKKRLETDGCVSWVDKDLCIGCKMCESVCPYAAIKVDPDDCVSQVTEALCKGCGTCTASCPNRAITLKHFTKPQLVSQINAALRIKISEEG
jgi:heterodisulfide reductase subunit A